MWFREFDRFGHVELEAAGTVKHVVLALKYVPRLSSGELLVSAHASSWARFDRVFTFLPPVTDDM
jgi:hypothetical protein